jgi:hypothetical protein
MSEERAAAAEWRELHPHLAIAIVGKPIADRTAAPPPPPDRRDDPRFGIFDSPFSAIVLVRVKSDSEIGRAAHNDLLGLIRGTRMPDEARRELEESESPRARREDTFAELRGLIPEDSRFVLMRGNAEVPANPVRRMAVLAVVANPGLVLGFDYKDKPDDKA